MKLIRWSGAELSARYNQGKILKNLAHHFFICSCINLYNRVSRHQ